MTTCIPIPASPKIIGFVSTRFHGTDGVTLEARKWCRLLEQMGHDCFWMAGLLDAPTQRSHEAPLAYFGHPEIQSVQANLFGVTRRSRELTNSIQRIKDRLKDELYTFIEKFQIEVLVPENILAIPMHVPLGLAMTEVIAETGLPVIAHHHDFAWERERFTLSAVNDYLQAAFPPLLHGMEHVVINSMAQKELARRLGIPSQIIPNVLDFETPPLEIDEYSSDLRRDIGLAEDDWLILQPTRIVHRKGIEHAIELVRRLGSRRAKLVFSHPAGDEGDAYMTMLKERVADANIDVRFISDRVGETRGVTSDGKDIHTLRCVSACRSRHLS
jgi:glycosyltransferase involved in cell wall biosynthesis